MELALVTALLEKGITLPLPQHVDSLSLQDGSYMLIDRQVKIGASSLVYTRGFNGETNGFDPYVLVGDVPKVLQEIIDDSSRYGEVIEFSHSELGDDFRLYFNQGRLTYNEGPKLDQSIFSIVANLMDQSASKTQQNQIQPLIRELVNHAYNKYG